MDFVEIAWIWTRIFIWGSLITLTVCMCFKSRSWNALLDIPFLAVPMIVLYAMDIAYFRGLLLVPVMALIMMFVILQNLFVGEETEKSVV